MAELVEGQRLREGYAPDEFTIKAVAGVLKTQGRARRRCSRRTPRTGRSTASRPLERSILRLAVWEIQSEVTPPEVAIDEAVRLTKRYSTDEAGAFVNGVLGGIVRAEQDEEQDGVKEAGDG